jgi:hypothetical protein
MQSKKTAVMASGIALDNSRKTAVVIASHSAWQKWAVVSDDRNTEWYDSREAAQNVCDEINARTFWSLTRGGLSAWQSVSRA